MTYQIPEPKQNPQAALVIFYKVLKGIQFDDRTWDKIHFPRCMKAAKDILAVTTDFETAKRCLEELSERFESSFLSWTLETIAKNAHEWKIEKGGKPNVNQARTRFLHSLNEQRSNAAITLKGKLDEKVLLGTLRDFGIVRPEDGPEVARGVELRGADSKRARPEDLETKTAGGDRGSAGDEQPRRIA